MSDEVRRKLAAELRGLGLIRMARDAEHGYYSDFDSPLATPKMTLAQELAEAAGSEARSEESLLPCLPPDPECNGMETYPRYQTCE